jgi:hypothetical protein
LLCLKAILVEFHNRHHSSPADPQPKIANNFDHENPARLRRNQNSEYLAQRRKGRKEIKLPDLAFLASWREQTPFWIATGHRKICAKVENF